MQLMIIVAFFRNVLKFCVLLYMYSYCYDRLQKFNTFDVNENIEVRVIKACTELVI